MPKLITSYSKAKVISVTKLSGAQNEDWKWRKGYIGAVGNLEIYESVNKAPKKMFAYFNSQQTGFLKTNFAKITTQGNIIKVTTPKSVYKFEVL